VPRKSSIAAVIIGVALLAVASFIWVKLDGNWQLLASLPASIATICFWWPLLTRPTPLSDPADSCLSRVAGILCLLVIVAVDCLLVSEMGSVLVFGLTVQAGFGVYLFRKPRFLAAWSLTILGLLILDPVFSWLYLALTVTPPNGGWNATSKGMFFLGLMGVSVSCLPLAMFAGALLAILIAWWLEKRAEWAQAGTKNG
jgi:hypothetical protein